MKWKIATLPDTSCETTIDTTIFLNRHEILFLKFKSPDAEVIRSQENQEIDIDLCYQIIWKVVLIYDQIRFVCINISMGVDWSLTIKKQTYLKVKLK
jgi:hypothetical protein